jgi:hypothetical protein
VSYDTTAALGWGLELILSQLVPTHARAFSPPAGLFMLLLLLVVVLLLW